MPAPTAKSLGCPLPPADLADRDIPIVELNLATTPLWRIHRSIYDPLYFNRRSRDGATYRFDAARGEFGVLYASPSFAACMAETIVRDRFQGKELPLMLDEQEITSRSITSLGASIDRPLRLADLTKPHFHLGMDNRVLTTADYRGPNRWSSAIFKAYPKVDGIYFTSRFANEPSVAIFDRVPMIKREAPVPLHRFPLLAAFLDKYDIGIAPASDPWTA